MIPVPEDDAVAIELTPIVDMVFLLLIFFLVATTFHQTEREMNVSLPDAATAAPISVALKELVVNVDSEGDIIVSGRTLTAAALIDLVQEAVAGNPEQKVAVRADRRASWDQVIGVLDAVRAGGVTEPWLDTVGNGS